MKRSKILALSLLTVSSIILSGCNGITSSNSSIQSSGESTSSASSNSISISNGQSNSSTPTSTSSQQSSSAIQNVIFCQEKAHVKLTPSKLTASFGEIIDLDIKLDAGYEIDHIEVNGKTITGTSFVMPNGSALVEAFVYLVNASGMMLTGDVSEQLVFDSETGVYVARNVKCASNTRVAYSINNKILSVTAINNHKTFANILLPSSGKEQGFVVAGSATYDFFYDPSDPEEPCYVRRTKVDALPQTPKALEALFSGSVGSETCVYPEGVTKVEYESSKRDDRYVWELYSDNSSLATVKNYAGTKDKGIVYKSIDDSVYTVVDSYVEKHDGHDTTSIERADSVKFAGKYDVVSLINSGHRKYQYTNKAAINDANLYSHTMESIDFDIMYSYRTGFENMVADDIYTSDIKIDSTPNSDGTFNTTINSWVSVKKNGAQSGVDASYHNEYDVQLLFTAAGGLLEVTYNHKEYNENQYDFERNQFKTGGQEDPVREKDVHAKYTYGTKKAGKPSCDISKYFVSNIKDLKIVNSKGEDSTIERMDTIEMFEAASTYEKNGAKYVSCTFEPSTALDVWQYGVVSSSNEKVVNNKNNDSVQYPFDWVGNQGGTTKLTIGNHTKSTGVTASFDVTSEEQTGNVKSVFAYVVYPYTNDAWNASSGSIYAGATDKVKLCASLTNGTHDQYADLTVTSSNTELLKVEYNIEDGYLYLDATDAIGIENATTIILTIGASYAADWGPSTLSVKIVPAKHQLATVVGEWEYIAPTGSIYAGSMVFTDTKGTITAQDGKDTYVVEFDYTFDVGKQYIYASNATATKNGVKFGMAVELYFDIDVVDTGYIGVYCAVTTVSSSGDGEWGGTSFELFGGYIEEDEGTGSYGYEDFKPVQK